MQNCKQIWLSFFLLSIMIWPSNVLGKKQTWRVSYLWFANKSKSIEHYVEKYKSIALSEMKRTHIPASITLAQGIIESRSGNSYLAKKGNNHFGIKCHGSWKGKRIYAFDDNRQSCFRKYKNAYASFIDHSNFLVNNSRYDRLFTKKITDYTGWAKGLKKAGYATNPKYAFELIDMIERYELHKLDKYTEKGFCDEQILATRAEFNGIKTLVFNCDILPEDVLEFCDIDLPKLLEYNNLQEQDSIAANTMIYIQSPKMQSIDIAGFDMQQVDDDKDNPDDKQLFGVKERALYRRNKMERTAALKEEEYVSLRKKAKYTPILASITDAFAINKSKKKEEKAKPKATNLPAKELITDIATADLTASETTTETFLAEETLVETPIVSAPKKAVTSEKKPNKKKVEVGKKEPKKEKIKPKVKPKPTPKAKPKKKTKMRKTHVEPIPIQQPQRLYKPNQMMRDDDIRVQQYQQYLQQIQQQSQQTTSKQSAYHKVGKNETLFSIAQHYRTTVDQLKQLNRLRSNRIYEGQRLMVK